MKLISWNVNGLRSVSQKGFSQALSDLDPDVLCLQEIKANPWQVDPLWPSSYGAFWNPASRPGYSGTLVLSRRPPVSVSVGIGEAIGDVEGRSITLEFPELYVVNVYTPNVRHDLSRLQWRQESWDPAFRKYCRTLAKSKPVAFCGDLNVAHEEIDLANPKSNRGNPGFTDEEREEFSKHLKAGFLDSFRELEKGPGHYSWWSYRSGARERNVGWRIDYVCLSKELRPALTRAFIRPEIGGSDHCPVGVELSLG